MNQSVPTPSTSTDLQRQENSVDSIQRFSLSPQGKAPAHRLPGDPAYFSEAVIRFAPLLDKIGVSPEDREPFLRDLSSLVASALDTLFPVAPKAERPNQQEPKPAAPHAQ